MTNESGSLYQLFAARLACNPDHIWLQHQSDHFDYARVAGQVDQLAELLTQHGLRPGDRVALYMAKSAGLVAALLACSRLGLIAVPVHMVLKGPQLNHILNDAGAAALIIDARRQAYVEAALEARSLSLLVTWPGGSGDTEFTPQPHQPHCAPEPVPERFAEAEILLYTSGSTGKPKGVAVSRGNLRHGAQAVSDYLALGPGDRLLALLSFAFDYGLNQLSASLYSGARLVLSDFLLAADVVRQVKHHGVSVIAAVPPLWLKLLEANWDDGAAASVRLLTNSGGRLPAPVQERLLEIFSEAELVLMYGLTEAFRSTYLPANLRARHPDAIGQAIPGAEVYVINDRGEAAAPGEAGELVHCGPLVTLGYWGAPELSAERFRAPPLPARLSSETGSAVWSGDRVVRKDNGLLYFVGRADGLIKSSGYRISPEEVEEAAYTLDGIRAAVALGIDDPALGQQVALVVQTNSKDLTPAAICQHLRARLPEYMVPRQVYFWPELPRTPSGKFDRAAIKAQLT